MLNPDRTLDREEIKRLADLLADELEKHNRKVAKPLSDYALSRERIYEDCS